jgi:hypothetical protein
MVYILFVLHSKLHLYESTLKLTLAQTAPHSHFTMRNNVRTLYALIIVNSILNSVMDCNA